MSTAQKAIKIDGMTCVNCALSVERAAKKAGIKGVVNFPTRELIIEEYLHSMESDVEKMITNAGFEVVHDENAPKSTLLKDILFWLVVTIAIFFMAQMFFPKEWKNPLVDFLLGTPALFIGIWKFGKGAWNSIKSRSANMYVLILLGAITAFIFSVYLMIKGEHMLYFETTAVIIALVMVGDRLEEKAINQTTSSLASLARMQIKTSLK